MIASNAALGPLLEGVSDVLLAPPVNCIRVALHPDGLAPRILNLPEWKGHLVHRLQREAQLTGDPRLAELLDEALGYPGDPAPDEKIAGDDGADAGWRSEKQREVTNLLVACAGLFVDATAADFRAAPGTAVEVTVSELSVEAFFPADSDTADWLRQAD